MDQLVLGVKGAQNVARRLRRQDYDDPDGKGGKRKAPKVIYQQTTDTTTSSVAYQPNAGAPSIGQNGGPQFGSGSLPGQSASAPTLHSGGIGQDGPYQPPPLGYANTWGSSASQSSQSSQQSYQPPIPQNPSAVAPPYLQGHCQACYDPCFTSHTCQQYAQPTWQQQQQPTQYHHQQQPYTPYPQQHWQNQQQYEQGQWPQQSYGPSQYNPSGSGQYWNGQP
ncbi:hypothetical protein K432DRAFT_381570 [Lepidopterella palustris CBS 459.81]|uniref:Uncharacterized protein n=1 Tax=Lepidopterella palustris CBS 459.81 TaxID=1314670 RepID=A0A8E2EC71_9PEZI|nr:hypothetical protein K432DRAFT_381570 [Lepidopterella palustris CBS 459.81]